MIFEWDENKNVANFEKHGVSFDEAKILFNNGIWRIKDTRFNYGENRFIGFGYINGRLLSIVYTEREPNKIRVISLRKANTREVKLYEKHFKDKLD